MKKIITDILPIVISILALISSIKIGKKQVEVSKQQADAQNKVELYLLSQPITCRSATGDAPDKVLPAIYIRNVGANVVYLDKYTFNGREYPLRKEVLPPVSAYNGYHYIYLPTDGTTHVSLTIDFYDWKSQPWQTAGYADLRDGIWEISYEPCRQK